MHNNKAKNIKSMMWMMFLCLIPLIVLSVGVSKSFSTKYLWLIVIGICVVPHVWMMVRRHRDSQKEDIENKINESSEKIKETKSEDNNHKSGGCCH